MAITSIKKKSIKILAASELAAFCQETSTILKAGIPLHDGLTMLFDDMEEGIIKNKLKLVSDEVSAKKPLYEALTKAEVFPEYMIKMVEIGSMSGKLDDVMSSLAVYYEREDELRQSIKSAVVYPMVLIVMMFAVMLVLAVKVLPVFSQVFISLGTTMSPTVTAIMNMGLAVGKYAFMILLLVVLIALIVFLLFKTEKGRAIIAKMPSLGKFSEKLAVSRFASAMALMLASGLDTERAIRMTTTLVTNIKIRAKINNCLQIIEEHNSFIEALYTTELFPKMKTRMLSIGLKAGSLDLTMGRIATALEEEIEATLIKRVSLIEPISVALLSIMIGGILIAVMLPLMGVMSSIG
ncbi:MAG: type II secretion system F family protein [Clostridia bacterium]